jgi:cytochrome c55X
MKKYLFTGLLLVSCAALAQELPAERQAELKYLLYQDCGSCHGMTLQGGLGPALLPENLQGKPEEYLSAIILAGRPGTPMPPWNVFLTEQEAAWLASYLKTPGEK